MAKRIKLSAEFGAWPLWDMDDPDNLDPAELPLSKETIDRLYRWSESLDAILNQDYPPLSKFPSEEAAEAFRQEGFSLWKQLHAELGSDYEVYYFAGKERKILRHPSELEAKV
jgi:hypothetical protein